MADERNDWLLNKVVYTRQEDVQREWKFTSTHSDIRHDIEVSGLP